MAPSRTATLSLLVTACLMPLATAHPADAYVLVPTGFGFNGLPPGGPPVMILGPVTIGRVTLDATFFPATGAGTCTGNVGQACLATPTWNPMTMAPPAVIDCQITGTTGPWPGMPAIWLVQDLNGDGVLENGLFGTDAVMGPIGLGYGAPIGPQPFFGFGAGAAGGAGFIGGGFGGPFVAGLPLHIVLEHQGVPVGPWSLLVSATVTCLVI